MSYGCPRFLKKEYRAHNLEMLAGKLCSNLFAANCQAAEIMSRALSYEAVMRGEAPEALKKEWEEQRKKLSEDIEAQKASLEKGKAEFRREKGAHDKQVADLALKVST